MRFTVGSTPSCLVWWDTSTRAGIVDEAAAVKGLLFVPLQFFGRTEAPICVSSFDQMLRVLGVVMQAFRLYVWAKRTTNVRPFIPVQLSPFQIFQQTGESVFDKPCLICVFNSNEKLPSRCSS